jgi:hypothetical protein
VKRNAAKFVNGTKVGSGVVQIDESWAFGQILAVVMIIAILNEFVHFLFGYFARRRKDRLARERQEREKEAAHPALPQVPPTTADIAYRSRGPSGFTPRGKSPVPSSKDKDTKLRPAARERPLGQTSSEYELHNLGQNVEVSETIIDSSSGSGSGSQSHDQPIGMLR